MKNKNAITMAELIIVISILAILWVVWFLSLKSYLTSVRDSSKIVELENIESALGSYFLRSWRYPEPDNSVEITYSWWLVWTQWLFWTWVSTITEYSPDKVLDPSSDTFYTYSVKNTKKEFSLAGVLEESPWLVTDLWVIKDTHAWRIWIKDWTAIVKWNYNWELIFVKWNTDNYILAIPSIISSDLSSADLNYIIDNNKLVYDGLENLPHSYSWSIFKFDSNLDISANNLVVYSWSINKLQKSYNQLELLQNLASAYSWSILWNQISVNKVDSEDIFSSDPSLSIKTLSCDIVNFKLKYFVECWDVDFITFYIVNVLHLDISILDWEKIITLFEWQDWVYAFWTEKWLFFYDSINDVWVEYGEDTPDLLDKEIFAINQSNDWHYWIWTPNWLNELYLWDPGTEGYIFNKWDDVWNQFVPSWSVLDEEIKSIDIWDDWVIWVWTTKWAGSFDWENFQDYKHNGWKTKRHEVSVIYTDSQGYIWFWWKGKWLDRYDTNNPSASIINYKESNGDIPYDEVQFILEDSSWKIWIWTKEGIWLTTDFWNSWETYILKDDMQLTEHDISYIHEDAAWNIWVATNGWVSKYSWWSYYSTSNWYSYSKDKVETDVQWLDSNEVKNILEDDLWNILIFTSEWLNTIDTNWDIVSNN